MVVVARTGSKHTDPAMTVRVPDGLKDAARQALTDRGRELRAFVVACLTALRDDPDRLLTYLRPYWPDPKPRGRPPADR